MTLVVSTFADGCTRMRWHQVLAFDIAKRALRIPAFVALVVSRSCLPLLCIT